MSRGSPIIRARVPQTLLDEIEATIARRNRVAVEQEWTLSAFVLSAIIEKIAKMARSRTRAAGPKGGRT